MEISNAHHQAMSAHQLEEVLSGISCPKNITIDHHHQHQLQQQQQEKKVRPIPEQALKCPRCDSTNTKFCYYNNYSLSQPRYFCKGCRRYWTQGGSLRNVPVGGGCRKNNKRSSNSKKAQENQQPPLATAASPHPQQLLPPLSYDPNDLSLAFASLHKQQPNALDAAFLNPNPNPNSGSANFLDVLRGGGFVDHSTGTNQSGGFNSAAAYNYVEAGGGNMLFPFEGGDLNLGGATASAAATGESAVEGSWIGHGNNNVGVDATRDYWNGVGSYWHGIINSSLM